MPKVALPPGTTDEDYVLALLRATGVLCVYGSGFGTKPEDGFFRVVFLASPGGAVGDLRSRSPTSPRSSSSVQPADPRSVTTSPSEIKPLILWTIAMTALAVILLWAAYLVRDVLLLLYISGLLAIGFSPIVRLIERQKVLPIGTRRFPRWLAILILYLVILGTLTSVGALVFPPLVDQAQQLWTALPEMFDRGAGVPDLEGHAERAADLAAGGRARARRGGSQAVGRRSSPRSSAWPAGSSACSRS